MQKHHGRHRTGEWPREHLSRPEEVAVELGRRRTILAVERWEVHGLLRSSRGCQVKQYQAKQHNEGKKPVHRAIMVADLPGAV